MVKTTTLALDGLERSILHWKRVVEGEKSGDCIMIGPDYCPLCHTYNNYHSQECEGCPIKEDTGLPFCKQTPYKDASELHGQATASSIEVCQKELDYLIDLLGRCEVSNEPQ